MKWQCNLRDGPSPHRTPFSTFVLSFGLYSFLIFFFFGNLSSFSFQVSTSFDPYQRAYFYFSTLLVSDKGIDLNTLKSAVIWPWALETVKLPRTKTVNTEQKQPWFNIVNLISLILCSLFFFFSAWTWPTVQHFRFEGHWEKSPSLSRADIKGKLTFPIAFYLPSISDAYFIFFPCCRSNFCPLLISLLTLIRLMSLITRWVFPKLPLQYFPSAADL